ncbi:MAG: hypothetical protein QM817_40665 [Archangium sp.]
MRTYLDDEQLNSWLDSVVGESAEKRTVVISQLEYAEAPNVSNLQSLTRLISKDGKSRILSTKLANVQFTWGNLLLKSTVVTGVDTARKLAGAELADHRLETALTFVKLAYVAYEFIKNWTIELGTNDAKVVVALADSGRAHELPIGKLAKAAGLSDDETAESVGRLKKLRIVKQFPPDFLIKLVETVVLLPDNKLSE